MRKWDLCMAKVYTRRRRIIHSSADSPPLTDLELTTAVNRYIWNLILLVGVE